MREMGELMDNNDTQNFSNEMGESEGSAIDRINLSHDSCLLFQMRKMRTRTI